MFPFGVQGKANLSTGAGTPDAAALLARAPKLGDAVERVTTALVKSLQKMATIAGAIEGGAYDLAIRDLRDVVASHEPSAAVAFIQAPSLSCTMLATIDGMLVHALVDLMCGGGGREVAPQTLRAVTTIDQQFAHIVFKLLAAAMDAEWRQAGFGSVGTAKCEALLADSLGPRVREVGVIDITIRVLGVAGRLRLVLPPAGLDRFADEELSGERAPVAVDGLWSNLLRKEIGHAPVQLDAYLDAKEIDLGSLAALAVGQIIALPVDARAHASLVAQGRVLFRGEVGQAEDRYSVRIDDVLSDAWRSESIAAPRSRAPEPFKA